MVRNFLPQGQKTAVAFIAYAYTMLVSAVRDVLLHGSHQSIRIAAAAGEKCLQFSMVFHMPTLR